jgi:hypothetical protein
MRPKPSVTSLLLTAVASPVLVRAIPVGAALAQESNPFEGDATLDTRIGELSFESGYPTDETVRRGDPPDAGDRAGAAGHFVAQGGHRRQRGRVDRVS